VGEAPFAGRRLAVRTGFWLGTGPKKIKNFEDFCLRLAAPQYQVGGVACSGTAVCS
jgi:hypothetical protein